MTTATGFDALASSYRWLERLAFGGALMRARVAYLDDLRACRRILVLGDGDGRALPHLLAAAPSAHIDSVDISARMLALAAARLSDRDRARVTFITGDARAVALDGPYDGVVTAFVLDCFTPDDAARVVARVAASLTPAAVWIHTDFTVPATGLARLYAQVVVAVLYAFFRWRTGIEAQALPPVAKAFAAAGLVITATRSWRAGLITSQSMRAINMAR